MSRLYMSLTTARSKNPHNMSHLAIETQQALLVADFEEHGMYLKGIFCEVLARQAYYAAALSPHVVDVELVNKGLHDTPEVLRADLQRRLNAIERDRYDAVLLGYGLCSNSIVGLVCPHTRMVVPRAHDCITLYLGSKERYADEFRATPGTYWYTADYIERSRDDDGRVALGAAGEKDMSVVYQEYVEKYGRDNADYLMEVMGAWRAHYSRAAYIEAEEMPLPDYVAQVQEQAARRGWVFEKLAGSIIILRDLIEGRWDDERFLIVSPRRTLVPTYDARIIREADSPEG
jgi:hypothetical protein